MLATMPKGDHFQQSAHSRSVPAMIGSSPPLRRMVDLIQRVGQSNVSVLIHGESGTGKELAARAIHDVKSQGPYVPIDCGALPPNLIESELFGHERGAYTGASETRVGLLQTADGGTAFLDEVGELTAEAQVKLLRVLQQQQIRRVGSNEIRRCAFRVIAATNRDLAQEVRKGTFRLDLYYRINVVTIEIPSLRERREDIPQLFRHFLSKAGSTHRVPPDLIDAIIWHAWPGNVRELENCVKRLVALTTDDELHVDDLPFHGIDPLLPSLDSLNSVLRKTELRAEEGCGAVQAGLSMASAERLAIDRALAAARGGIIEAARALGISRTTLYRKLKKYEKRSGPA